ncbi:protein AAR2 homolog [Paramacrobiotus metropolitanus]|uniref:protein AAR2 homolog n=1 Tax=Paramacrobiotus metropolitanus TaxID=2943436 RepID=UPI00244641CA|nr:protein AAR2 homolog [Paramacrobiotus metropolitanus]
MASAKEIEGPVEEQLDSTDLSHMKFYSKFGRIEDISSRKANSTAQSSGSINSTKMDPETARCLFEEGAFLIFLDVPEKTEFGIDVSSWNVGEKFKGVKMIPPGIHFVHYSAVSKHNVTAPRTGFFHDFKRKEVVVKRWDRKNEGLDTLPVCAEESERYASSLQNLDPFLGAYPYDTYKRWISMSRWITDITLLRLVPTGPNGCIFAVQQLESQPYVCLSRSESPSRKRTKATLPEMKVSEETRIRFSDLSTKRLCRGAQPSDITSMNMDKSVFLDHWIADELHGSPAEVLGEVQFAFVCFLVGQVYDAFEQWKNIVALLSQCEKAMLDRPDFFLDVIGLLYFQVQEIPKDFFVDVVSQENFLTNTLQSFFAIAEHADGVDERLRSRAGQFRKYLQKMFKWDFSMESNEDAPVVVDL